MVSVSSDRNQKAKLLKCADPFLPVERAPPRPPLPREGVPPVRPPPPETDDEDEVFRAMPHANQSILVSTLRRISIFC